MGFPSPASDYIERRIDLNDVLMPHRNNMILIETPDGFALVDGSLTPRPGNKVASQVDGYPMIGKYFRTGIITEEGETMDGESLEGVVMLNVVTHEVLSVYEADWLPF